MNEDRVDNHSRGGHSGAADSDTRNRYLLVAGPNPEGTGAPIVASASMRAEARRAFLIRRLQATPPGNWARLANGRRVWVDTGSLLVRLHPRPIPSGRSDAGALGQSTTKGRRHEAKGLY